MHQFIKNNKAWKREPNPFSGKLFASDNRSYKQAGTSRIAQKGIFKYKGTQLVTRTSNKSVGASENADPIYKITGYTPTQYGSGTGGNPIKKITGIKNIKKKTAPDKGSISKISGGNGYNGFNLTGKASYPFSSIAPDIDYSVKAMAKITKKNGQYYANVYLVGSRNNFPAYEAFVYSQGKRHYFYKHSVGKNSGPGLINLNSSSIVIAATVIPIQ